MAIPNVASISNDKSGPNILRGPNAVRCEAKGPDERIIKISCWWFRISENLLCRTYMYSMVWTVTATFIHELQITTFDHRAYIDILQSCLPMSWTTRGVYNQLGHVAELNLYIFTFRLRVIRGSLLKAKMIHKTCNPSSNRCDKTYNPWWKSDGHCR